MIIVSLVYSKLMLNLKDFFSDFYAFIVFFTLIMAVSRL